MSATTTLQQVTPDVLLQCLRVAVRARRPAFTWGSPGIGKSDIHRQLAKLLNAFIIDVRASQLDAVDLRGVPYVDRFINEDETDDVGGRLPSAVRKIATTRWAVPSFLPTRDFAAQYPLVIIFLDELNAAPQSVQAAFYQLIWDRRLGDYVLPDNVVILAAGNLETDRAITHRLSTALANRFAPHLQLIVDPVAWERWAITNDLHTAVITYPRWRPENLYAWDARAVGKAQPTLRTWEATSDLLKVTEEDGVNGTVESALIAGTIGESVGAEFSGYLRIYRKLQDPAEVIAAPDKAAISSEPSVNWALCGALANLATVQNCERVFRYAARLADDSRAGPEFMTLLVRSMTLRTPAIQHTRAFTKWASENSDVLL